jgi:hypothetical protein
MDILEYGICPSWRAVKRFWPWSLTSVSRIFGDIPSLVVTT